MTLDELLAHGRVQSGNLTFYKLVFQALERLAFQIWLPTMFISGPWSI